ncbi:fibrinogen-binding adhesin SdrG C-terminal domain-containing protein, partial [Staphylococcus epidermidis]|uniref:fibrinogen-binding adhesin SdrG C-terminal domain-containing protein n=1 Tax=Staphylococcus epidermidis TaxID=1282 RepID=UPI0021B15C68
MTKPHLFNLPSHHYTQYIYLNPKSQHTYNTPLTIQPYQQHVNHTTTLLNPHHTKIQIFHPNSSHNILPTFHINHQDFEHLTPN